MKHNRYWMPASLALMLSLTATACGSHAPSASHHHHHKKHHHSGTTGSSSSSPSVTPSVTPSTVAVQTPANPPSPVLTTAPPAGGVANANQVQATVNSVQFDGTTLVDGQTDNVFLLNATLRNPTTAMILFQLNDIIVAPTQSNAQYSLNDYDLSGITPQNSLFPYPIVPQHAEAVVVRVPSGESVTGDFTVEAPAAGEYAVTIAGSSGAVATFSN